MLKAFLLSINSPPIYTNIHIDNIGVINRSSNSLFSIPQCLLPDWEIFKIRPCKSVSLSLGSLRYNTSKDIRTVTQALLRPPPTSKTQYIGRCRNPQAYTDCSTFHQAPIVSSTPVKLVINGLHITSTLICPYGLLHTYHVNLL